MAMAELLRSRSCGGSASGCIARSVGDCTMLILLDSSTTPPRRRGLLQSPAGGPLTLHSSKLLICSAATTERLQTLPHIGGADTPGCLSEWPRGAAAHSVAAPCSLCCPMPEGDA
eukprot:NODE_17308_length_950_cov_6.281896.p2 GENE.NODE_17308_length_950_cov_6.281896~~NODE_17308_length_950_cov_6.281896.p2  ORF type:complete len:115 (+),score=12.81 NODE_17308_length_950_cov_6.281896:72-416(+)